MCWRDAVGEFCTSAEKLKQDGGLRVHLFTIREKEKPRAGSRGANCETIPDGLIRLHRLLTVLLKFEVLVHSLVYKNEGNVYNLITESCAPVIHEAL